MKNKKEILIITLFSLSIIICVVLLFRTAKLSAALEALQKESSDVIKESKQEVAEDIEVFFLKRKQNNQNGRPGVQDEMHHIRFFLENGKL